MAKSPATKKRPTPEERRAKKAHDTEAKIKKACSAIKQVWVAVAGYIHEFHAEKMWEHLGFESFNEWLASPEISLGRSQVYALMEAYEELVIKRGLEEAILAELESTKIVQVLPALRRGDVDLETALADVQSLSKSDLRAKYGNKVAKEKVELIRCDDCGCMKQPMDPDDVGAEPIPGQMSTDDVES